MKREKSEVWYESFESTGEPGGREVFEAVDAFVPRPTGVLDRRGVMIYREPEKIGFRLGRRA